ncbi:HTH-type transcriptional regulator LeuO [compost metagenome]|uniref:HTH-type transcriptional regulator LeuO n=1 Tax=Pseudomonas fluorescens TaxID=294 RepID=A0A5E6PA59_PSEFL|nr:LysR family transcriptional regulator [Pseudomonas fluorescens]VVM38217.1 HTH-type transcriptional regulator LeuO [Pseudomonas fluorescens]
MHLDETELKCLDFDALIVLLVVFRERNVSRAAICLNITQPAVSNVLSKLRRQFDDPLFVRCGKGVIPTDRATKIANMLGPVMVVLQKVVALAQNDR